MPTVDSVALIANAVGTAAIGLAGQLADVAQPVAEAGTILAISAAGLSIISGAHFLAPIVRMTLVVTGFSWAIAVWPALMVGMLDAADGIVAMMIPGWAGPTSAFTMASEVSQRISAAWPAFDWSSAMISNMIQLSMTALLISICLYLIAIAVLATKVLFLVAGSLGPLLLCLGIIPGFLDIGLGPVRFLLRGALTYIGTAAVGAATVEGITGIVGVGGLDQALTTDTVQSLFALSLLGAVLTLASGSIGGMLTTGSFGGGGARSVVTAGNTVVGGATTATSIGTSAATAAGKAATSAGQTGRAAMGAVRQVRDGSPFG